MLHALSVVKCIGFTFKDEDSNSVHDEYMGGISQDVKRLKKKWDFYHLYFGFS